MPELEVLEAKVPVRTPRLIEVETEPKTGRFAPVAGWLSGPVFSRARDIFAQVNAKVIGVLLNAVDLTSPDYYYYYEYQGKYASYYRDEGSSGHDGDDEDDEDVEETSAPSSSSA